MRFAVVQRSLEPPPVQPLARAFAATGVLTSLDAATALKGAYGILAQDLNPTVAASLQDALEREQVPALVVEMDRIPRLPRPALAHRAEFTDASLIWYTATDRRSETPWSRIRVVASGLVRKGQQPWQVRVAMGEQQLDVTAKEEDQPGSTGLLLDLALDGGAGHVRIEGSEFRYDCLGARMQARARDNFPLLVRDILERADAVPNRGAARVHLGHPDHFLYPTARAFEDETRWILWRLGDGRTGAAPVEDG